MNPVNPVLALLLGCGGDDPGAPIQQGPLGDVSLREAQLRIEGVDEYSSLGFYGVAGGDLDGDGLTDLAATSMRGARVALLGGPEPVVVDLVAGSHGVAILDRGPDSVLVAGERAAGVLYRTPGPQPAVTVWSVGRAHATMLTVLTHERASGGSTTDYRPQSLGDVDGDGLDDLGVVPTSADTLYLMDAAAFQPGQTLELEADAVARVHGPFAGDAAHGDLDGDGLDDLIAPLLRWEAGVDAVVAPAPFPESLTLDPAQLPSLVDLPGVVASGGDLDGDGLDDVVVSGGDAVVLAGPILGEVGPDDGIAALRAHAYPELLLYSASIATDLDGDGFDDLLAGSIGDVGVAGGGVTAVWYGPTRGIRGLVDADARLIGETPGDEAGRVVLGLGDTDGDGFGDLAIGAAEFEQGRGAVYLLRGGPTEVP